MTQSATALSIDPLYDISVNGELVFKPFPEQIPFWTAKEPNVFLWGNRGGGKSHLARMMAHRLAIKHPGFRYIIVRRSYPELLKTHIAFLPEELDKFGGPKNGFTYNKTEHIAYYPKGSLGFYFQCDNDDDVRKVLGAEAALLVFDEAPELEWEWMAKIRASVRVPKGSKFKPMVRFLGNPIGPSIDELWRYFIDKDVDLESDPYYNPADWRAIELRLESNPYLDTVEYRKQFSGLPAHFLKAWRDGERTFERALFSIKPTHILSEMPLWESKPLIQL